MQEEIDLYLETCKEMMEGALEHLRRELVKLRTGKASSAMLDGITVDYHGMPMAIYQVANVNTPDARTITIQPWEKKMLSVIEKAIFETNMGLTPQNDGTLIRLMIPPLTEERRKALAKQAQSLGEHAKVGTRNARRETIEEIKKAVKGGYPEDAGKKAEEKVQKYTDEFISKIEKVLEAKEKEIMTV